MAKKYTYDECIDLYKYYSGKLVDATTAHDYELEVYKIDLSETI